MPVLVWADIPVADLDRAVKFYAHVLGKPVEAPPEFPGVALVRSDDPGPNIDLVVEPDRPTTTGGTTIYLGSNGDIDGMLARVAAAGGTVLEPKKFLGPIIGWLAYFKDSEGNRIGIQQPGDMGS
jgi:predicted enzyme related to lactoylglutathione lyase